MEAAPGGKLQLRKAPAKHAAAAAAQNLQNRGIRIHADGKARQESVAVGKCTGKEPALPARDSFHRIKTGGVTAVFKNRSERF